MRTRKFSVFEHPAELRPSTREQRDGPFTHPTTRGPRQDRRNRHGPALKARDRDGNHHTA